MLFIARTISAWINNVFCYHYGRFCWWWWWRIYVHACMCARPAVCSFFCLSPCTVTRMMNAYICMRVRASLFITILLMAMPTSHQYSNRFLFWPLFFFSPPYKIQLFYTVYMHFGLYISILCVCYKLRISSWYYLLLWGAYRICFHFFLFPLFPIRSRPFFKQSTIIFFWRDSFNINALQPTQTINC